MASKSRKDNRRGNKIDSAAAAKARAELVKEIETILDEARDYCRPVYELLAEAVARFEEPETWAALLVHPLEAKKARRGLTMLRKMIRNMLVAIRFAEAPDREKLQQLLDTSGLDEFVPDEDLKAFGELVSSRRKAS